MEFCKVFLVCKVIISKAGDNFKTGVRFGIIGHKK